MEVGNTPLIQLSDKLYGKLEAVNPGGSIKDRPVKYILDHMDLNKDDTIVEATSGNTGISLAMMCAERGLKCVIVYGDPIGRLPGQSISDEIKRTEVLELTRLFIHDGYGSNIESWFISQSFNWLRKNKSEIKALISYASPVEGHSGTIYQATNWIYQGNNNRWNDGWIFKFEEDGRWIHGRTIFPYYKTNDPKEIQKQVDKPFWIRKELQKHRYVYILAGKKDKKKIMKTLKHETLPYPKSRDTVESDIIKMEPLK